MSRVIPPVVVALILVVTTAGPVSAIPQFQKVFLAEYVNDQGDADYTKFVTKEVKCYACHQGKKSKKNRNAFGKALSEFLDAKKDKKDTEKIKEALAKVMEMPSDPDNKDSKTFGELIKDGKLPAGELDDLKKEPKDGADADDN